MLLTLHRKPFTRNFTSWAPGADNLNVTVLSVCISGEIMGELRNKSCCASVNPAVKVIVKKATYFFHMPMRLRVTLTGKSTFAKDLTIKIIKPIIKNFKPPVSATI